MSDQALMSAVTSSTTACKPVCVEPQLSFADQEKDCSLFTLNAEDSWTHQI